MLPPNLASRLDPLIDEDKVWVWTLNNKLKRMLTPGINHHNFWIWANHSFVCHKWSRVFFELLSQQKMVHSHCHNCWKVCIYPRTFAEVIAVEEFQAANPYEGKVGMDIRDYTSHIWSGYWYTRSIEEGWERWKFVREWLDENHPEIDLILKRACTEFEMANPDSSKWEVTEDQAELEQWLDDHIDFDPFYSNNQCDALKEKVRWKWMNWAHAHGDFSYLPFTGGLPMWPPYRTYHDNEELREKMLNDRP